MEIARDFRTFFISPSLSSVVRSPLRYSFRIFPGLRVDNIVRSTLVNHTIYRDVGRLFDVLFEYDLNARLKMLEK